MRRPPGRCRVLSADGGIASDMGFLIDRDTFDGGSTSDKASDMRIGSVTARDLARWR